MIEKLLDIRTLAFISLLFSLLYGFGLVLFSLAQKRFKGVYLIGLGNLSLCLGFTMLGLRGYIPDLLSIVAANGLALLCTLLYLRGLVRFREFTWSKPWTDLAVVGGQQLIYYYFTYIQPNVSARIIIINLMVAVVAGLCVWVLLRRVPPFMRLPHIITTAPFVLLSVFSLFRALWTFTERQPASLMNASLVHAIAFVVYDIQILMASYGVIWIASSRLEHELREQARHDPLTGVFNRMAMEEIAAREISRARRHKTALSVVMTDLDHFKRLNDSEGHQAGDLTLTATAKLMKANLRAQDALARYGGEEFLIILPDTNLESAVKAANKLKSMIETNSIKIGPKTLNITASFGVAVLNGQGGESAWKDLVSRADLAMYRAKQKGRNRVEIG